MDEIDENKLIDGWLTYQRNWWAFEALNGLIGGQPKKAWEVLKALIGKADTDSLLERVGSGPLEDFINFHGAEFIEQIEDFAKKDPKFSQALAAVWIEDDKDVLSQRLIALGCAYISRG